MKKALVFWFTGLSGSGKTTIAEGVKPLLESDGYSVLILDGDDVRKRLHHNLGFTESDIKENNALIAKLCQTHRPDYDIILVPVISPYESSRRYVRGIIGEGFYEIYFNANINCVISRDPKNLYAKAKQNLINNLIGYSQSNPYEVPEVPDLIVMSGSKDIKSCVDSFYDFTVSRLRKTAA